MSPISSRNSVPPSAESTRPFLPLPPAPVKEPASWPNSSLSMRLSGSAAQFTATKGLPARGEEACSALARCSLPTPVSP